MLLLVCVYIALNWKTISDVPQLGLAVSGQTADSNAVYSYWPEERSANITLAISWVILSSERRGMSKGFASSVGTRCLKLIGSHKLDEYIISERSK
jgi:hypothetical protein